VNTKLTDIHKKVLNSLKGMIAIDDQGVSVPIKTIWGTDKRLQAHINSDPNKIKDIPIGNLFALEYVPINYAPASSGLHVGYCFNVWTLFLEEQNQAVEQMLIKFCPEYKVDQDLKIVLQNVKTNLNKKEIDVSSSNSVRLYKHSFYLDASVDKI
jgi:hypothetical protein